MSKSTYLKVDHLTKRIRKQVLIDDISLQLDRGKIYGFTGKNGSGKTMLFKAICGLIKPSSGFIEINGKKLGEKISFPESVGAIIEYPGFLPNYTGFKNLKMIADIKGKITKDQIKNTIESVGLNPDDKRKFKNYSLGMKQRLGIAQAIMEDPELIILDEPTNALDKDGISLVKDLLIDLKEKNKLILLASHESESLKFLSDEIFTVEKGKIINHIILKS
ncbi:ATP-binding cassette domain-containing protein [Bacillus spizizenii]|uniref:Bacitracin transport ATP-binding protein BcrA n=1 Tax=Bacillus spizizenii (strain DSM 15029 / JCM 12233 / NBRC 101239 / NRRL B-23049 / TU-B-10) TaxID=1052585 RepID=G4P1E5_BACS4|nr:ATP-binding cassette domain-containing protein [Bacillus spizizenii]AEP88474.1 bacitracin transport ATP-binding protein BcrA [Bacillus spizizenii TU-B-10]MCI4167736.1 ATP-binding cassette domain-containing protein [Bacillus spizizenii]GEK24794.1 multidrug ABC transporter ATP-binding protein [Bacillus spizizenii]